MHRLSSVIAVLLCLLAPSSQQALHAAPAAQQAPPAAISPVTLDQAIDRFIATESALALRMAAYLFVTHVSLMMTLCRLSKLTYL